MCACLGKIQGSMGSLPAYVLNGTRKFALHSQPSIFSRWIFMLVLRLQKTERKFTTCTFLSALFVIEDFLSWENCYTFRIAFVFLSSILFTKSNVFVVTISFFLRLMWWLARGPSPVQHGQGLVAAMFHVQLVFSKPAWQACTRARSGHLAGEWLRARLCNAALATITR